MGSRFFANLACWTFLSMTRFEPIWRTMRSSLGRLNAAVRTPWAPSPVASTSLTTRMGASAPSLGFRYFASSGRLFSISWRWSAEAVKILERGVGRERGGFVEERCGAREIVLVGFAVGDEIQHFVGAAADDAKKSGGLFLLDFGELLEPGFEFGAGHVLGIEVRA